MNTIKEVILKTVEKNAIADKGMIYTAIKKFLTQTGVKEADQGKKCDSNFWQIYKKQGLLKRSKEGIFSLSTEGKKQLNGASKSIAQMPKTSIKTPIAKGRKAVVKPISKKANDIVGLDLNILTYSNSRVEVITIGNLKQIKVNDLIVFSSLAEPIHIR